MTTVAHTGPHRRVAIVGAGFSGLSVAARLRERGEEDFGVLERGSGVDGVWRDNIYPGVACDVPSHLYSLLRAEPGVRPIFLSRSPDPRLPGVG